jgi:hypothetical protein
MDITIASARGVPARLRQARVVLYLLIVIAATSLACTSFTSKANADSAFFCPEQYLGWISMGPNSYCLGARHSLTSVNARSDGDNHKALAGAWTDTGQYANWAEGWGRACHSYGGENVLYPAIGNPHSIAIPMWGSYYWGSGGSTSC